MQLPESNDPRNPDFLTSVERVKEKIGRRQLEDDEMIVLAVEEISRTFTHEERGYRS